MSVSVPLITDPRNQLLETLPFVCTRASNQCHEAIRRVFDDETSGQTNVTVMLHLVTRNGPTLMEMIANVVRNEGDDRQREARVILMGREVDPGLAGLLRHCNNEASATESAVALSETNHDDERFRSISEKGSVRSDDAGAKGDARASDEDSTAERGGSESNISSITLPSFISKLGWGLGGDQGGSKPANHSVRAELSPQGFLPRVVFASAADTPSSAAPAPSVRMPISDPEAVSEMDARTADVLVVEPSSTVRLLLSRFTLRGLSCAFADDAMGAVELVRSGKRFKVRLCMSPFVTTV